MRTADGKTNAILMNTYDPAQKNYRIWRFTPGGSCEEMAGKWDEATSTLTITTDLGHGITQKTAFHLIDKDHLSVAAGAGAIFAASGGRLSGCVTGAEWNVAELAPCPEGTGGGQPGRIKVRRTAEIDGSLMDG